MTASALDAKKRGLRDSIIMFVLGYMAILSIQQSDD